MAGIVQAEANALLAASSGQAAYVAPVAPVQLALVTVNGSNVAAGTEVVGGSYARQTIAWSAPAANAIATSAVLNYVGMPAVTVVGVEEWDSAAIKVRRYFAPLAANKTTNAGDTFTILTGSYSKILG
jgi:hypothetical protein